MCMCGLEIAEVGEAAVACALVCVCVRGGGGGGEAHDKTNRPSTDNDE